MKAFTYIQQGKFGFTEKVKPTIIDEHDAIVRVTLSSICTSDLHIKHGSVPRAVPGITVGHEMVGIVEEVGERVSHVKPGDRVTVNVETFCGECFYCKHGYVNNCTSPHGGWALGCRIDGGQTEYVRVPYATTGLNKIPDSVSDEQALFVGDILATGFWATRISEITEEDTVLIIGAGPTGVCCLLCTLLKNPRNIIVCEKSKDRREFIQKHYPQVMVVEPEDCEAFVKQHSLHGGADVVMEETTEYPWNGDIKILVKKSGVKGANLLVRIPGWVRNQVVPSDLYKYSDAEKPAYSVSVNGKAMEGDLAANKGYLPVKNIKKGDVIRIHFDMPVRTVVANGKVVDDRGKVAVERGPLVYCAEAVDNDGAPVLRSVVAKNPAFSVIDGYSISNTESQGAPAFSVKAIQTDAQVLDQAADGKVSVKNLKLTLIPYYAWNHRGANQMNVWFYQDLQVLEK